jgi:aminoglycoside phosphotransferase (APT) family kinase protein
LWLDPDGRWLGTSGYVMARVRGRGQHPAAFIQGPIAEASPADREEMLGQVMAALVAIHNTDIQARGLQDFVMNAPGVAPPERLINWYWRTWDWVRLPEFERLVPTRRWLLDHLPDGEPELMHGDSTLQNYFFDGTRLSAVLDWEMSSLGRAEADLALQCLSNRIFAAAPDSGLLQPPSEEEWLAMYHHAGGRQLRDFDYFKKFAAYMILVAVSALQRNMTEAEREAQAPLLQPCWQLVES